jgi:hypothetical protein
MAWERDRRNRVSNGVVLLASLGLALGACSALKVSKLESDSVATKGGGVRYALRSPKWQVRVKETQGGQVPSPDGMTATFEIDADPVYVPDEKHIYEVTLEPGWFTSDSLKVKLDEYGSLSRVSASSEPQFAEVVKFSASVAGILLRGPGIRSDPKGGRKDPKDPKGTVDKELKRLEDIEKALEKAIDAQAAALEQKPTKEGSESLRILQGELSRARAQIAERIEALATVDFGQEVTKAILREPLLCNGRPDPGKHILTELEKLQKANSPPVLVVVRRNDGTAEKEATECKWWREVSQ